MAATADIPPPEASVEAKLLLDFLYADHERVASFLAQIQGEGSLKETNQAATAQKKSKQEGGLKLGLLDGKLGAERDWSKEVRHTFDPLWANSRKLIDHFEGKMAEDTPVALGQLRILSGTLIAYDFSSIRSLMNADAMDDFIASGISDDNNYDKRSAKAKADKKKEAGVIREFMKGLPLGIGFVLVTDSQHFWFSVKREYLSLYDLDVPLKFPAHISGKWSVLGVIDALPYDHVEGLQPIIDRNIDGLFPAMVLHMMQLTGATAAMFGRPFPAHGLSPLVVYREVRAEAEG